MMFDDFEIPEKDKLFLKEINYLISRRLFIFLKENTKSCFNFEKVKLPKGNKQKIYAFDHYIDEYQGHELDDFSGCCYIRLANNEFLKWSYDV